MVDRVASVSFTLNLSAISRWLFCTVSACVVAIMLIPLILGLSGSGSSKGFWVAAVLLALYCAWMWSVVFR